jgi:3'-5' exonuclease
MAICGFDIPFIAKRCLYHQIEVPEIFDLSDVKPWESGVFYLMNIWKMTSFYPSTLSTICYGLNVPSPKLGAVKGSNVGEVYYDPEVAMEDKLLAISSYCSDDVLAVLNVIVALYSLPQYPTYKLGPDLETSISDG